jgi:hypothetical protein
MDQITVELVDDKCLEWRERGVDCECIRRSNRKGYKAGALKEVRNYPASVSSDPTEDVSFLSFARGSGKASEGAFTCAACPMGSPREMGKGRQVRKTSVGFWTLENVS